MGKYNINKVLLFILGSLLVWILTKFALTAITQVNSGHNLIDYANKAHQSEKVIEAWRGKILDRNGDELVSTRRSYDVYFKIKKYKNDNEQNIDWIKPNEVEALAPKIAKILNFDSQEMLKKLRTKGVNQVEIGKSGKDLTVSTKEKLDKLNNAGIHFVQTTSRYYADPLLGSMLFGYTQKDKDNKIIGVNGIEKYMNDRLSGKDGTESYLVDREGFKIPHTQPSIKKEVNPQDIKLTIDQHIQTILEREVNAGQKRNNAEWVMGIITDAKTNKVLGASASPGFNLESLKGIKLFNSPLANDTYEPGSVMKIFTWSNAIENGNYNGNARYMSGHIDIQDFTIKDHVEGGWGMTTYDEGFYRSSNVAAIKLTQMAGRTKTEGYSNYLKFLKTLGFGSQTGVEIADEKSGHIPSYTSESEVATTTFGQNILVTPFQLLQGMSILTSDDNGLYAPRLIDTITDSKTNKVVYKYSKSKVHKLTHVIKKSTAKKVLDLMYNTVSGPDFNKTGTNFAVDGYKIGVKTGSAQIADEISHYSTADNLMLLSGMSVAPIDNPKVNIYIAMKRPHSGQWDIPTIYRPIAKDVLAYLGTSSNSNQKINKSVKEVKEIHLPSLVNMSVSEAKDFIKMYGFKSIILGNGNHVLSQLPNNNEIVFTNDTIILNTSTKKIIPNFNNYSEREARNIAKILNLRLKVIGSGYVYSQSRPPHYEFKDNETLTLKFR